MSDPQLDQWLAGLVDDSIDDAGRAALADRLRSDEAARERYHDYMELHAQLRWGHGRPAPMRFEEAGPSAVSAPKRLVLARITGLATAAAVVLVATLWWALQTIDAPAVIETAAAGVQIERDGNTFAAAPGTELADGDVVITSTQGTARVRYSGENTTVALQIDTAARFGMTDTGKSIELRHGSVACDVDPQPKGRPMVLRTRDAKAVVLGTRFVLDADDHRTRLEVTEGSVQIEDAKGNDAVQTKAGWFSEVGPGRPLVTRRIADIILADGPVAYWRLNLPPGANRVANLAAGADDLTGRIHKVAFNRPGPPSQQFPDFEPGNTSAEFDGNNDYLVVNDPGDRSVFDFENGDAITLEAWINPRSIKDDTQVYIIGKGRTKNAGFPAENHNWGLRIRGEEDLCKLSFIFRDADNRPRGKPGYREDWHRWVSIDGFVPNSGWHHVAVTYKFGDPDSLRGYIDGVEVRGFWDYGGKTSQPPVVDNDEVWIGSALGGQGSSSFDGLIDEIAIYRKALSPQQITNHYRRSE